jgi:hypothetical protein
MNIPPALDHFCTWLRRTDVSVAIQSHVWVVPTIQSVHILSIGAVTISALSITLRLFGRGFEDGSTGDVSRAFSVVIGCTLPVLLLSGALMIIAEPVRSLGNPVFLLKMVLLLVAASSTLGFQWSIAKDPSFWDVSARRRWLGRLWTLTSLALWAAITFAGRWIDYVDAL